MADIASPGRATGAASAAAWRVRSRPVPVPLPPATQPRGPVEVDRLRHPTEPSRLALALIAQGLAGCVAALVLLSLGGPTTLLAALVAIPACAATLWVCLQIWRIRLLADAVPVSMETFPELRAVLDDIKERLDYRRRLDLFVVDKISKVLAPDSGPVALASFFGVHVLVAEGDEISQFTTAKERQKLTFLLATYVGTLKARHDRWYQWLSLLRMTGIPSVVFPFVYPWLRATVYSGDRIAYTCCGDLEVSLEAVYQTLVGKKLAPYLRPAGLAGQALTVRRRLLLRLTQLLRPVPHATNRYLELLAFIKDTDPCALDGVVASLGGYRSAVDAVLTRPGQHHPVRARHPLATASVALMLIAGALLSVRASSGLADMVGGLLTTRGSAGEAPSPTPAQPTSSEQRLLALVPADLRAACSVAPTTPDRSMTAALSCPAAVFSGPAFVGYYAFDDADAMLAAFEEIAGGLPAGACTASQTGRRGQWTHEGESQGPMACYHDTDGDTIAWGSSADAVLVAATDADWTSDDLFVWWQKHATLASP